MDFPPSYIFNFILSYYAFMLFASPQCRLPTCSQIEQKYIEIQTENIYFIFSMISLNFALQESKSHVTKSLSDRWDEAFPCIDVKVFSLHKLPKTLPGTTLLLFGPATLFCRLKCETLLFYLTSEESVPLLRL